MEDEKIAKTLEVWYNVSKCDDKYCDLCLKCFTDLLKRLDLQYVLLENDRIYVTKIKEFNKIREKIKEENKKEENGF